MPRQKRTLARVAFTTLLCFALQLGALPVLMAKPPKGKPPAGGLKGNLAIFTLAKGAQIEVDGKAVGKSPLPGPIEVSAGDHTVRVSARGYTEYNETIEVRVGETTEVEADLIAFAGIVQIASNVPGATVAIDGKLVGTVPFDKDVTAGKHEIVVQSPGKIPFKQMLDIVAGKPLVLTATLADQPQIAGPGGGTSIAKKWWFWTIIGGLVAGGAAAGLALGLQPDKEITPEPNATVDFSQ